MSPPFVIFSLLVVFLNIFLLPVLPSRLVKTRNYGKHFIFGFTEQHSSFQTAGYIKLAIVTLFETNVTITMANSVLSLSTSYKNGRHTIEQKLPASLRMQGTSIESKGIEVTATEDIAVICFNHASSTADAYLALPTHALGHVYVIASYKPTRRQHSNTGIISGSDGTKIVITYHNEKLNVNLARLETFQIKKSIDLSGSLIVSNKPISVVSGDSCANVGSTGACDLIGAFLLPVMNWGKEYVVAPTGKIASGDIFRIFAYENDTVVQTRYGESTISSREFKEIDLGHDLSSLINCSKPCQVVQYVNGRLLDGSSADPSMIVLPSVNQFLSHYNIVINTESYSHNSITLIITYTDRNGLLRNGAPLNGLTWQKLTGTKYAWTVTRVSGSGAITFKHSSYVTFGLLVFGWGSSVSYGYPGGFSFTEKSNGPTDKSIPRKCSHVLDLGFILDSSGSITAQQFQEMKDFVKDMTRFFNISQKQTRLSLMTFSSSPVMHIYFRDRFNDQKSLHNTIDSATKENGGTATADALNLAYTDMFSTVNGARPSGVRKALVILTDGQSNSGMVYAPAQKLKNTGITIFSVGLGENIKLSELEEMASDPDDKHVILLKNFSQLAKFANTFSNKTCNIFSYTITCKDDSMEVAMLKSSLPKGMNPQDLNLKNKSCTPKENETHVKFDTPLGACGDTYSESDWTISFSNVVRDKPESSDGVITRVGGLELYFSCSYERKRTVGGVSFKPARAKLTGSITGVGNFTLKMDIYESNTYKNPHSKLPITKSMGENIYVQYSIATTNAELVVYAETCSATPTNKPYDRPHYIFVRNGCATDKTMRYNYGLKRTQQFSIETFRFLGEHTMVYLHCDLIVCNRNTPNSPCSRGLSCSSAKRKRRADPEDSVGDHSRRYPLSLGPFMISREKQSARSGDDAHNVRKLVFGVGSATVFLLCVVVVIVIALMKRRSAESVLMSEPKLTNQRRRRPEDDFALENKGCTPQ